MITTIGNKHAQVMWQEDEDGMSERAILVTNYAGSGVIEIKQGDSEIIVNYESVPELIKVMKTVKGMRD